ncbi:hypothetical protein WAF17_21370 [Bernardetia sp. ABR2-2B]|uniref:hypothetical protein n=1 Tax=Bernardetia sp. ABR2-2B TaxID=3127472 RepID=UPI0030D5DFF6
MELIIYKKNPYFLFCVLVISFLFVKTSVLAQVDDVEDNYEYDTMIVKRKIKKEFIYPDYKKGDMDFYLSPIALLEPFATIYFGTEYFLKDKISVYTDVGYILNLRKERSLGNEIALPHSNYVSYVLKPEIRFYDKNNPQKASYHGIKFMFRNMNYKEQQVVYDEYFFDQASQSWTVGGASYDSDYRTRRRSVGVQYVRGWKGKFAKTWTSNFYFGAGVRFISNKPIDKRPEPFGSWNNFDIGFLDLEKQYKLVSMDVSVGLRIGTKLKPRIIN